MGSLRVVFETAQSFGGTAVPEMTVQADRLVLLQDNKVVLDVAAGVVAGVDRGAGTRTERLRSANRNHGRAWSAAEENELRRLWADGLDMAGLADHFGRSRGSIGSAVRRLSLPDRPRERPAGAPSADGGG